MIQDSDMDLTARIVRSLQFKSNIRKQLEEQRWRIKGKMPDDTSSKSRAFIVYYTVLSSFLDSASGIRTMEPVIHFIAVEFTKEDVVRYNYDDPYCRAEARRLADYSHTWNKLDGRRDGRWGPEVLEDIADRAMERFEKATHDISDDRIFIQPFLPLQAG